jgi:hypothetical protein
VVSDLLGLTGRGIIEALIRGEDSAERLSWKARGNVRKKEKQIEQSLKGCFDEFHRALLGSLYKHYQFLSTEIANFERQVETQFQPYAEQVEQLAIIPGVEIAAGTAERSSEYGASDSLRSGLPAKNGIRRRGWIILGPDTTARHWGGGRARTRSI